jgi:hypothetical protein
MANISKSEFFNSYYTMSRVSVKWQVLGDDSKGAFFTRTPPCLVARPRLALFLPGSNLDISGPPPTMLPGVRRRKGLTRGIEEKKQ